MTKATRKLRKEYGHKLRRGQLYRASKPGEAPAKRTGALRLHWIGHLFVLVLIHFFHLMNKTIPLINQQTIEFPIRSHYDYIG